MGIKTNPNKLIDNIISKVLKNKEKILEVAAEEMRVKYIERIFEKGQSSRNTKIGNYDTKKLYLSKKRLLRPLQTEKSKGGNNNYILNLQKASKNYETQINTLQNKITKSKKIQTKQKYQIQLKEKQDKLNLLKRKINTLESKNERRTVFFPRGYRQARQKQGLPSGFVNLTYSGYLQAAVTKQKRPNDSFDIIFKPDPNFPTPPGLKQKPDIPKIIDGIEIRYGKVIFEPTQDEINTLNQAIKDEIKKAIQQIT